MQPALFVAQTGLSAQDTQLQVISNNLANVSTVGFKRDRAQFEDLLYQARRQPGAETADQAEMPNGLMLGNGVRLIGTQKQFDTGGIQVTDQTYDMAIYGQGFFQIQLPDGDIGYTRNGQFSVNSDGDLVTQDGYLTEPQITLPNNTTSFTVRGDGTVVATVAGNTAEQNLGQLELANFVNPQGLEPVGQNLFRETPASGDPLLGNPGEDNLGQIQQGALESSNVNAAEELVNLITTQRAYEMNSRAISTADDMLSYITQQL